MIVTFTAFKQSRTVSIQPYHVVMLAMLVLSAVFVTGLYVGNNADEVLLRKVQLKKDLYQLKQLSAEQKEHVQEVIDQTVAKTDALSLKMAQMQARLLRMEALGERIAGVAKLDNGEFDFTSTPSVGGPEGVQSSVDAEHDLELGLKQLHRQLDNREKQFSLMQQYIDKREFDSRAYIAGQPITKGWLSSRYGRRVDPFTGKNTWHKGVDFASPENSDVIAVASGVVSWSGKRQGYGNTVEINHGNGYATLYAHNKANHVKVGDVVERGQKIASVGSSGRSTGPHVHFEVYKDGKAVDPLKYIQRSQ